MKCKKCGHSYEDHANVYDANSYGETTQDTGCYECVCEAFVQSSWVFLEKRGQEEKGEMLLRIINNKY